MKLLSTLGLLVALALAAPSIPGQSANPANVVKRWAPNDRAAQVSCRNNGVKSNAVLHDCNGHALTPEVCLSQCRCWNGNIWCPGWNKCSETTMGQVCRCGNNNRADGQCDDPGKPCVCKKAGTFKLENTQGLAIDPDQATVATRPGAGSG